MRLTIDVLFLVLFILFIIDLIMILKVSLNRIKNNYLKESLKIEELKFIEEYFKDNEKKNFNAINKKFFMDVYISLEQRFMMDVENKKKVIDYIEENSIDKTYIKGINSWIKAKRKLSSTYLGYIKTDKSFKALSERIKTEKQEDVKIYLVNALIQHSNSMSFPFIIDSLNNSTKWYQEKILNILRDQSDDFYNYIVSIIESDEEHIKRLILKYAGEYPSEVLKNYIFNVLENDNEIKEFRNIAINSALKLYYDKFFERKYIDSTDNKLRRSAILALKKVSNIKSLNALIGMMNGEKQDNIIVESINEIIEKNPFLVVTVADYFYKSNNIIISRNLAVVLSNKIEYIVSKLFSIDEKEKYSKIIEKILLNNQVNDMISFMNKNKNKELENQLVEILKSALSKNKLVRREF